MKRNLKTAIAAIAVVLAASTAFAEYGRVPVNGIEPSVLRIDDDKFLGAKVDGAYGLVDANHAEFKLSSIYGVPVILVLSYYGCDGACATTNKSLKEKLGAITRLKAGKDYRVLTASFDKDDDAAKVRMFGEMTGIGGESTPGWKTAVLKRKEDIKTLTDGVGFKFFWSKRDNVFTHTNVYIVLTPEGRVHRYLYASLATGFDIEAAIAEARFGQIGAATPLRDLADLYTIACYSYNYKEGRYTLNYPLIIAGGSLTSGFLLVGLALFVYKRKARR
ncbi:MAG: hypothetical protein HY886_02665 [Deltaproteobacteria bacterium]|nr:hypothetical protein [Deltaproteobacteria bacterium]